MRPRQSSSHSSSGSFSRRDGGKAVASNGAEGPQQSLLERMRSKYAEIKRAEAAQAAIQSVLDELPCSDGLKHLSLPEPVDQESPARSSGMIDDELIDVEGDCDSTSGADDSVPEEEAAKPSARKGRRPPYQPKANHLCVICGDYFSRHVLYVHQREMHPCTEPIESIISTNAAGKKLYGCSYCKKTFAKPEVLFQHKTIHSASPPLACDGCGKGFRWATSLRVHKKNHCPTGKHGL